MFLRSFGGAMLDSPGPLDKGLDSFFAITPPREDWTDEQVASMLRENNARALKILTIHEATPGHYLQLAYSNRTDSLVRAIFSRAQIASGSAISDGTSSAFWFLKRIAMYSKNLP